jgi:LemA protein
MKNIVIILLIIAGILFLTVLTAIPAYNSMIKSNNNIEQAWSNLQAQYQSRYDKIDNLVATVKGAAGFEKSTLTDVINARANATKITIDPKDMTPEKLKEFQSAQGNLSQALGRLMFVSEQYPNLKTSQNFLDLQAQIEGIENRILRSREEYNKVVLEYNNSISTFPRNIIAGMFGFQHKSAFEAIDAAQNAPKVDFGK